MILETVSHFEIPAEGLQILSLEGGGKSSYQHVYRAEAGVYWNQIFGAPASSQSGSQKLSAFLVDTISQETVSTRFRGITFVRDYHRTLLNLDHGNDTDNKSMPGNNLSNRATHPADAKTGLLFDEFHAHQIGKFVTFSACFC